MALEDVGEFVRKIRCHLLVNVWPQSIINDLTEILFPLTEAVGDAIDLVGKNYECARAGSVLSNEILNTNGV